MTETLAIVSDTKNNGQPQLLEFVNEYGRLPRIGDDHDPWTFRGWLFPYLELCEADPRVSPRYDYVNRTIEAGRLLEEPIPQCVFVGEGSPEAREGIKMLEDMIKIVEQNGRYSRGIEQFCEWLGFALCITEQMPDLPRDVHEKLYRNFDAGKWLIAPTDYIGQHMAESNYGRAAGFFPTPMEVCTLMAMMTFGDGDSRALTVDDCAVGTGRTLLAASNYSLRLSGNDINGLCVLATKINLALFAPWHCIPSSFFPDDRPSLITQSDALLDGAIEKAITADPKKGQLGLF